MAFDARMDRVNALCKRIRAALEGERQRLQEEIRAYPTPIPRCDVQFNQLIERRELLFRELAQLDAAAGSTAAAAGDAAWLGRFIDASGCLDEENKAQLKAALGAGLAILEQS